MSPHRGHAVIVVSKQTLGSPLIKGRRWLTAVPRLYRHWLLGIAAGIFLAQVALLALNAALADRPIVGLRLQQQNVSGQSRARLAHTIDYLIHDLEGRPIRVHASHYTSHVTPRQLGAKYDAAAIRQQLLGTGRTGALWQRIAVQDSALWSQQNIRLGFARSDKQLTQKYLTDLNKQIQSPPRNAHFTYLNKHVHIISHEVGLELNSADALKQLQAVSRGGADLTLPTTQSQPHITMTDLQSLLPEVEKMVASPLIITAAGKQVSVPPEQIIDIIAPVKQADPLQPSKDKISVNFNDQLLSQKIDQLAAQVNIDPKPTVTNGKKVIANGTPGVHIDGTHARVEVVANLEKRRQSGASTVPVDDSVVIPTEAIDPPSLSLTAVNSNPLGRYPAFVGTKKMAYLTFDDGPGGYTENILDILKRYNVHAIFFVVGKNVALYPQTTKRIIRDGHTIGNHSYTHSNLATRKAVDVASELAKTQAIIQSTTGVQADLFRPPYGSINDTVRSSITSNNLSLMMWTVDPRDWAKPGATVITQRILDSIQPGSNILLHSIHPQTAQALPSIIEGIRAKGFTLP